MTMIKRQFNVSLIEKIGDLGMKEAWVTSKPTLTYKDENDLKSYLDGVIKNDLPLSGFHMFCLKIGSSMLFRDLLFTLRPIQVWALSSRITKLEKLGMENNYPISQFAQNYYNKVAKMQSEGVSLDISKRYCPLQQYTEYCVVLDLRTLVAFFKTVKFVDEQLYNSHCIPMIKCIGYEEEFIESINSGNIYDKLCIHPETSRKISEAGGLIYNELEETYELGVEVAQCLGAQFQRQHYARIRTNIWNLVKKHGYKGLLHDGNALTKFQYISSGEKSQWQQVLSRRICWEAQFCVKDDGERTSWNFILNKFFENYSVDEFKKKLPCKGCGKYCTIYDEGKLRLLSKRSDFNKWTDNKPDENPICPVMCETPEYSIKLRQEMYQSQGTIWELWKKFIRRDIKDNPNNLARKFYFGESDYFPEDLSFIDDNSKEENTSFLQTLLDKF